MGLAAALELALAPSLLLQLLLVADQMVVSWACWQLKRHHTAVSWVGGLHSQHEPSDERLVVVQGQGQALVTQSQGKERSCAICFERID